jgi:hypothetical protein
MQLDWLATNTDIIIITQSLPFFAFSREKRAYEFR